MGFLQNKELPKIVLFLFFRKMFESRPRVGHRIADLTAKHSPLLKAVKDNLYVDAFCDDSGGTFWLKYFLKSIGST